MKILKFLSGKKELFSKIGALTAYIFSGNSLTKKFKRHKQVKAALDFFKKQKFIFTRAYFIYVLPYISKAFDVQQKQEILINHYTFLKEKFSLPLLRQLFGNGLNCYTHTDGSDEYAIVIRSVRDHLEFEGSMYLLFKRNGKTLFTFSFTFVPGKIAGCRGQQAIMVSSIQGTKDGYEDIRKSTKFFKDNALPVILLQALEAVAVTLGITRCVGIKAYDQLSAKVAEQYERFYSIYDEFWQNNGGILQNRHYVLTFPLQHKPILEIAQHHRNRTLKKRNVLREISEAVTNTMNGLLQKNESITQ